MDEDIPKVEIIDQNKPIKSLRVDIPRPIKKVMGHKRNITEV